MKFIIHVNQVYQSFSNIQLPNLGLRLSFSEITLLFDLSLYLDRTLAQRKAKSKVKVTQGSLIQKH